MTHPRTHLAAAAIATALLAIATVATAQDIAGAQPVVHRLGEHPAILVKRQAPQIDPNTFILMHPAGLFVIAAPSVTDDQPTIAATPTAPRQAAIAGPTGGTDLRHSELSAAVAGNSTEH
jgi:hypothetical protein